MPTTATTPVHHFHEIDSTNLHARREFEHFRLTTGPAAYTADRQTGGVGRFGRPWDSPRGGLWCTLARPLPPGEAGDALLTGLGLRVGVALAAHIARTLSEAPDPTRPTLAPTRDVRLKWPNDVLADGKKICGVLCELVRRGAGPGAQRCILVGVGINANIRVADLRPELRETATSLQELLGRPVDLAALRTDVIECLARAVDVPGLPNETLGRARALLYGLNRTATVSLPTGGQVCGTLLGLDDHGLARLETGDGVIAAPLGSMIMLDQPGTGGSIPVP